MLTPWVGQQRALTLVQPHSKVVLQEAIKADCEFLAKSNIMDYSYVDVFSLPATMTHRL